MASPVPVAVSDLSEEEFERRTLEAIRKELGPGGVVRFIMAYRSGHGDYTADRQRNPASRTLDEIWRDLEAQGLTQQS